VAARLGLAEDAQIERKAMLQGLFDTCQLEPPVSFQ